MTWVFGYGSLVWRPDFTYVEKRVGHIKGYKRRFYQGSSDHRGTPQQPGRVVTLLPDPEAQCHGVAYLLSQEAADNILNGLDIREQKGYERHTLPFWESDGTTHFPVLVYLATPENEHYLGPASEAEIAAQIHVCHGPSGGNDEYLLKLASTLRELNLHDPHVFALENHLLTLRSAP